MGDGLKWRSNTQAIDPIEGGQPPSWEEALQWRRGHINDQAAARDRVAERVIQGAWNAGIAYRGAEYIEPATAAETVQLQNIEAAIAASHGPGIAGLRRDRQLILNEITERGRGRGPLCALGVVLADWAVDKVVFPCDHIKQGTVVADFIGATGFMFAPGAWRNKAMAMVAAHLAGRLFDHFLQGNEATNAGKPKPPWAYPSAIDKVQAYVPAHLRQSAPADLRQSEPVTHGHPPSEQLIEQSSELDRGLRQQNSERQRQEQNEALNRYAAWQEALSQWRREHTNASTQQEYEFMRKWYAQNASELE